jgi:hypothetical protein
MLSFTKFCYSINTYWVIFINIYKSWRKFCFCDSLHKFMSIKNGDIHKPIDRFENPTEVAMEEVVVFIFMQC